MRFFEILDAKKMSAYSLSKLTNIPYTTINDLIHYRSKPENISLGNALKICEVLEIDIKEFINLEGAPMTKFDFFRNLVINDLRLMGPNKFISKTIKNKDIDFYYKNGGIAHALFLLATIDYLARSNHLLKYVKRYNGLRKMKLEKTIFTSNILLTFRSIEEAESLLAIKVEPEYKRHNIVEVEIPNLKY